MSKIQKKPDLNLPDYVHPFGVQFRVESVPTIPDEEMGDDVVMGEMSLSLKRIKVVSRDDFGRRWSTLYHEYLHAVFGLIGIDDALEVSGTESLEEIIVRAVETATEQFMLQHGEKWLRALDSQKGDV